MNFVKRAAYSLAARTAKTALLLGIFLVVCTLLFGGFLLQGASLRQQAEAQRRIGVDVTVRGAGLTVRQARKLGNSPVVERYNPVLREVPRAPGLRLVGSGAPRPPGTKPGVDGPGLAGIRDSDMLLDFATGRVEVVEGRGITAADADRSVVMVEKRAAEKNRLAVGDRISLAPPGSGPARSYTVVGIFADPAQIPAVWMPASQIPANQLYVPIGALAGPGHRAHLDQAVYRVGSPERTRSLYAEARRQLRADGGFRFDVNDKAYRDQVRPLRRVGAFANGVVWLIAVAGTLILGVIVTLTIRERRTELGVLLALGEKKWRLVCQHTLEVTAVAVPALACAAFVTSLFADRLVDRLTSHEGPSRRTPGYAVRTESLPAPETRLTARDIGKVAGTSLGIALLATVVPGIGIVRLHPRSILTDSD